MKNDRNVCLARLEDGDLCAFEWSEADIVHAKLRRYEWLLNHVSAVRCDGFQKFVLPHIHPAPGANIMKGSVAQHFEDAIDHRMAQEKR